MRMRAIPVCLVFLAALTGLTTPCPGATGPASEVVQALNAKFIDVMKNGPSLGYAGRYKELEPALVAAFNFPDMARVSVGRFWKELSDAQKAQLVDAFRDYSVATYAARFKSFSGQRFEVLGEQPGPRDSTRVNNRILPGDGEAVRIDYLLREKDGALRIVDVYLKSSYSEIAVRRSEFTSIIDKEGFDGLLAVLAKKIGELEKTGDSQDAALPE